MRRGGRYEKRKGKVKRVEGTEPHRDGDRARDADGRPLNREHGMPGAAGVAADAGGEDMGSSPSRPAPAKEG